MPPTQSPNTVRPDKPAAKPGKPIPVVKPVKPGDPDAAKPDDLVPPDEKFWQRYGSNGEPLLSGLSSFVIHAVVIGMVLVGLGWLMPKNTTEEIEPVLIGDGRDGGGGGNVQGQGDGPQLSKKDVDEDLNKPKDVATPDTPNDVKVKADTAPKLDADPDAISLVEQMKQKKPTSAGVFIKDALEGITGKGGGGPGFGGGTGKGFGKGTGDGVGDGTGPSNRRGRRVLRWQVNFNTQSGADYVRQLKLMGAILGVPDTKGKLMVIRNLDERPVRPVYENVRDINRIFWVDDRAESARSVAETLQLDIVPSQFVAFYPKEIEDNLLNVEMTYGKKYGRKKEEDISETIFNVTFRAGKPVFAVVSQRGK